MMKTLSEIRNLLNSEKDVPLSKYPIKSLAVFGSYPGNEQDKASEVALMVEFEESTGVEFIQLSDDSEAEIGLKVDLVSRKGIKEPYFKAIESTLLYV